MVASMLLRRLIKQKDVAPSALCFEVVVSLVLMAASDVLTCKPWRPWKVDGKEFITTGTSINLVHILQPTI